MPDDRRALPRHDVYRIGEIWIEGRLQPIDCLVRNRSEVGALLEVLRTDNVPEEFRLTMRSNFFEKKCRVVRRSKYMLGVNFA